MVSSLRDNLESSSNRMNCFLPPHILREISVRHPDVHVRQCALDCLTSCNGYHNYRISRQQHYDFHQNSLNRHHSITRQIVKIPTPISVIYTANNRGHLPGDLVDTEKTNDATALKAHHGALKFVQFLKDRFNRNSIDDQGMQIISTVHYKKKYDNAFWNGEQMVYGDGDPKIFNPFPDSLDVNGHEMTHGMIQFTANLEYESQSGALNESISDVFGIMLKQGDKNWSVYNPDAWLIGDELLNDHPSLKVALRSMSAPGTAYVNHPYLGTDPQPATMDNYQNLPKSEDEGGVHVNSGIPNHAFYLVCQELGDTNDAGKIWYDTLQNIKPTTDFRDFAKATVASAVRLFEKGSKQESAVRKAWNEVKVTIYKTK